MCALFGGYAKLFMKKNEFFFIFPLVAALVGGILFISFLADSWNERDTLASQELKSVGFAVDSIRHDFSDAASDLEILSGSQVFGGPSSSWDRGTQTLITRKFINYLDSKRIYGSISLLGLDGMEKIRVDHDGKTPSIIEERSLASREEADYFTDALKLNTEEAYITFLGGGGEGKSWILFSRPVFNGASERMGVIVVAYRALALAKIMEKTFARSATVAMIADSAGEWILPPLAKGSGGVSVSFAKAYPEAWEKLRGEPSGQLGAGQGLFTFAEIMPPRFGSEHSAMAIRQGPSQPWRVISLIPEKSINAQSAKFFSRLAIIYMILVALGAVGLWILDGTLGRRVALPSVAVSPPALAVITIVIIFISEFIVMVVLRALPPMAPVAEAAIDAALLSALMLPMISLLLVRPLMEHIRERQKAEEGIKAVIRSAGEGIVAVDGQMEIDLVNEELLSIFGYREDELIGKKISLLTSAMTAGGSPSGDAGFLRDIMGATGRWVKIMGRRKNGDYFPMETRVEKASSGQEGGIYVVALRDITERETSQKALLASEEKFRSSFENAAIGMVLTGLDGGFIQVNNAFCGMVGYTKEELLAKSFADITHPGDVAEDLRNVGRALAGEIDSFQLEKRYIHKNGAHVWVLLNVAIVRDEVKAPRFFIAQMEDITERKKTETELIRAKEDAEESTLLKDKFVSLVAHDLRSPLVSITGLLKLMLTDKGQALSGRQEMMVKSALSAGEQSVELIDELLNISRLKTGVIKPKRRFLDARHVALTAAASMGHIASRKNVAIRSLALERARIFADQRLYTEVINNLLGNAIKFSHPGSVVEIFSLEDGKAGLCVRDFGVGIKKEYQGKLFRYDEKTHSKGTMGESGTGLGLPLSYDIMLAHGGSLEFTSQEGQGAVFYAALPNVIPRILVVERDRAILRLLESGLAGEEVQFAEADDFTSARAALEKTAVHLALVDIEENPEAGVEFISFAAALKLSHDLPIIAITAGRQAGEAEKALAAGAADFVTKPLDMEAMLARVRRFIV